MAAVGGLEAMLKARADKQVTSAGGAEVKAPAAGAAAPSDGSTPRGSLLAAIRGTARPAEPARQYREIPVKVDETTDFVERGDAPAPSDLEVSAPRPRELDALF